MKNWRRSLKQYQISTTQTSINKLSAIVNLSHNLSVGQYSFLLTCLALILRLVGITTYPLNGDEYNTLLESQVVGLNWNSITYFLINHFWIQLGSSDSWLRALSVLFGIGTIPIIVDIGVCLKDKRTGVVAGLLAAFSPFLIYHSQEVRFYSYFVFSSLLFFSSTLHFEKSRNKISLLFLFLSGLLLISSHFLGVLVLLVQILIMFVWIDIPIPRWARTIASSAFLISLFIFPFFPDVLEMIWSLYQKFGNTTGSAAPTITTISIINFAKVLFAAYVFLFGYHVYPLWLIIVFPGILIFGVLLLFGTRSLIKNQWGGIPLIYGITLIGIYFILDSLGGRLAGGVAPRHVAFISPMLIIILSLGIVSLPQKLFKGFLLIVILINFSSLIPRWMKSWSYGTLIDYKTASSFLTPFIITNSIILYDGKSKDPVLRYYPDEVQSYYYWDHLQSQDIDELLGVDRIVLMSNDFQFVRRENNSKLITTVERNFSWIEGYVQYPFFQYVFEKKKGSTKDYEVDLASGQVRQPIEIYGLEFEDLRLPVSVIIENKPIEIVGSFNVDYSEGNREQIIDLSSPFASKQFVLLGNITGLEALNKELAVAEVVISDTNNLSSRFQLRLGKEIQTWDQICAENSSCKTIYQWHKRIAFVGQQGYPGAWRDFQAGIHAQVYELPVTTPVSQVAINYLADRGALYIWGLAFQN